MIVQIIEHFHDKEARIYFIDSDLLDKSNPIDAKILKAIVKKKFTQDVYFLITSDLQDSDEFWYDPCVSGCAVLKKKNHTPEKSIILTLSYDC